MTIKRPSTRNRDWPYQWVSLFWSFHHLASYLWAAAILVWGLSVCQRFVQNMAYGEMATTFPQESGLPVTQQWADKIGADLYSENAGDAVTRAKAEIAKN
jgi:hypothetical protein